MSASHRTIRRLSVSCLLAGLILAGPVTLGHAQQAASPPLPPTDRPVLVTPEQQARATLDSEMRIRKLHDRLKILPDQESQWGAVAKVMRDNETGFRTTLTEKTGEMKNASAVNDLKAFQIIADHHASGLKAFIPVFEKLYESMPPAQQKRADGLFGEHHRFFRL